MASFKSFIEAGYDLALKLNDTFWINRATDMMFHLVRYGTGYTSRIRIDRANPDWPLRGTITVTREDDGKRFKLYMTKTKFKVKEI